MAPSYEQQLASEIHSLLNQLNSRVAELQAMGYTVLISEVDNSDDPVKFVKEVIPDIRRNYRTNPQFATIFRERDPEVL